MGTLKNAYTSSAACKLPYSPEHLSISSRVTAISRAQFQYSDKIRSAAIRLVQIQPGEDEDTINLSICTVPTNSAPAYIALSYTWGEPQRTCPIICDGKELYITQNLEDALWQLRQSQLKLTERNPIWRDRCRLPYFWIDAICINQSDDEEKSFQVTMMWRIYSRAELVIAWLGKQNEISKRGFEHLRHMSSMLAPSINAADAELNDEQMYLKFCLSELTRLGLSNPTSSAWDDLFSVFSRDWFSRVWVIQELIASGMCVFLCGEEFIDSSILLRIGKVIGESKLLSSIRNFDRKRILAVNVDCLASLKVEEHDFNTLLWLTHLFKASDQRDRIFSLVHMASGLKSELIPRLINYQLSVHEVLVKYARFSLAEGSLDVICYAQAFGDQYSLPSWVPYWTAPDYCYTPLIRSCNASTGTQTVEMSDQHSQIEPDDTLVLKGKIIDRIEKIIKAPRPQVYDEYLKEIGRIPENTKYFMMKMMLSEKAEDTQDLLNFHIKCLAEIRTLFQYPTGESLPDLYWRAYFMDDQRELPLETGKLFQQYIGDMEVNISVLKDLPLLMYSRGTDRFDLIPTLTAIATWSLSGTIWKSLIPKPLYRIFASVSITLLICSIFKWLQRSYILYAIFDRFGHSARFLDKHCELFTEAYNKLSGRNFCVTESGYVGWASLYAKKGDAICVFRGSRFPFAVREWAARHSGQHRLRGDVYLHGLIGENLFDKARANVEDIKLI